MVAVSFTVSSASIESSSALSVTEAVGVGSESPSAPSRPPAAAFVSAAPRSAPISLGLLMFFSGSAKSCDCASSSPSSAAAASVT